VKTADAAPGPDDPAGDELPKTAWFAIAASVAAGVVAALQVGKASAALAALRAEFGIGLGAAGWIVGIFALLGVVGGVPAGLAVSRYGDRRFLLLGLVALALGSAAGAAAPNFTLLLVTRVLEGAGFLFVLVAAPAVLERSASARDRPLVFGIWGAFMPTGIVIALLAGLAIAPWRVVWLVNAGVAVVLAIVVRLAVEPGADGRATGNLMHSLRAVVRLPKPLLLAGLFALYNIQYFALVAFLPTLLVERIGLGPAAAALTTSAVVGVNIAGNLSAGVLRRRGIAPWRLIATALSLMGVTGLGIFTPFAPVSLVIGLAMLFSLTAGLLPATVLGEAPKAAPEPHMAPVVMGLVIQGNNLGQLLGPATIGALVDRLGWSAAALAVAAAGLAGAALAVAARGLFRQ